MERKEAIEVIKKNWPDSSFTMLREALETLIPELAESEDEKIRKYLKLIIGEWSYDDLYAKGFRKEDILAWLEKQGEQKPKGKSALEAVKEEKVDNQNCVKPDKVEPKFKVGDYIERKDGLGCHAKIIFVGVNFYGCEKLIHSEDESPFFEFMFKNQDEFQISSDFKQKPTDKVEPDILIEESYQQQADDLIDTVTEKPAWSEDDEVKINRIVACLENLNVADNDILLKDVEWLKFLKDKYTWKPSDKQIEALDIALRCEILLGTWEEEALKSLYSNLKKLREE